jgi:hypothetical protein
MDSLPPWSLIEEMLRMLVLPALAAAAVALALVCAATRSVPLRLAGGGIALVAGLAVGNHFRELLKWWPVDEGCKLPWCLERGWAALLPVTVAAVAGGLLAAIASLKVHRLAGLGIRLLTAAGCSWCLADTLEPLSLERSFALLFAGTALTWEALLFAAGRGPGRISLPALTIPWGAAAAAVLIYAHSARFFDLAVLMTATLCGVGLITALWKLEPASLFAGPAVFFPALMLAGAANTYSEVPVRAFACVALAPCALWVLLWPRLRRLPAPVLAAVAVLLVLIPCIAGVVMAAQVESLDFDQ